MIKSWTEYVISGYFSRPGEFLPDSVRHISWRLIFYVNLQKMLILQSSIVSLWLAWYNRPGSNIGRCPCPYFSFEVVRSIINFTKSTTRNDPGLIPTRSDMYNSTTIEGQHLTISRDYVHSELPFPTIFQIWHLLWNCPRSSKWD